MSLKDYLSKIQEDQMRTFVVVFENKNKLQYITESKFYKLRGSTNVARFDSSNTNTMTQDHFHFLTKNGADLFAINRDGSPHDGSRATLSRKEIAFLQSKGFKVPPGGVLESVVLEKGYIYECLVLG